MGVRPSFDNGHPSVEAYLLDFDGDLYGETLGLSFIQRLRGEQRFADIHALISQMGSDVEATRRTLAEPRRMILDCPLRGRGSWKLRSWNVEAEPYWIELEHTADWAIRVTGDSQRQLFARAAAAMFALQDADPSQPIALARKVNVTAEDAPELLVSWLNRLLLGPGIGRRTLHPVRDS